MRAIEQGPELLDRAVVRMDAQVVRDVIAVVAQRRREEGEEPKAGDPEILDVVQALDQAAEVADAVVVAVGESADVKLIDDRVLVPERVGRAGGAFHRVSLASEPGPDLGRARPGTRTPGGGAPPGRRRI